MAQHGLADIVSVKLAAFAGVGWREGCAVRSPEQAFQQCRRVAARVRRPLARTFGKDGMDLVPGVLRDDPLVLARIAGPLVDGFAQIDPVLQEPMQEPLGDDPALLGRDPAITQIPQHDRCRTALCELVEDVANVGSFGVVHHQLAGLHVVSQWRAAPHPHALGAGRRNLVANALAGHFALELGEGQQHVERQAAHAVCRVERLGDRHERHLIAVEHLDQLGKVHERARQAVDLVDHHDIDQSVFDVRQQALQRRAFQRAARNTAVVILIADQHPAFSAMAGDIGLAGFPLGMEAVELLFQTFFR